MSRDNVPKNSASINRVFKKLRVKTRDDYDVFTPSKAVCSKMQQDMSKSEIKVLLILKHPRIRNIFKSYVCNT